MSENTLSKNVLYATKWSSITEVFAKLVVPITNMILARVLSPEAFGVIATITIIITFAEMISDSGFHKFLIQRNFESEEIKEKTVQVAFWTNLVLASTLWIIISLFNNEVASLVGNPDLGLAISIATLSLPLSAFSSIQSALYKRHLDFKVLFLSRIVTIFIPFIVTIPMAILGFGYWSLIFATLCASLFNAVYLTTKSNYKPKIYYSFKTLKTMMSFSIWSLGESIAIWATSYMSIFIIANKLSEYYLGLYNTTIITVNGIFALVTVSTTSVLFSSLSKLQNNDNEFVSMYLRFLRYASLLIIPMGVYIYIYRNLITSILLGNQWTEATNFVGIWGLMSSVTIIFGQYCSEVYRAKGKPKLSLMVQIFYLLFMIPAITWGASQSFETLIYTAALIKIVQIIINLFVMDRLFNISVIQIINTVKYALFTALLIGSVSILVKSINDSLLWEMFSIMISSFFYFYFLYKFVGSQEEIEYVKRSLKRLRNKKSA